MVSLVNFKIVTEEPPQQAASREPARLQEVEEKRMFIKVSQHEQPNAELQTNKSAQQAKDSNTSRLQLVSINCRNNDNSSSSNKNNNNNNNNNDATHKTLTQHGAAASAKSANQRIRPASAAVSIGASPHLQHSQATLHFAPAELQLGAPAKLGSPSSGSLLCHEQRTNFVVTWRNLKFSIEPKWHQRVVEGVAPKLRRRQSARTASSAEHCKSTTNSLNQHQQLEFETAAQVDVQPATPKTVLDKLDGSFKSGQLTAILGPSGAGKTTLLDCLTGHRKHGLTGSIKISSSLSSGSDITLPTSASLCPTSCASVCCNCHYHLSSTYNHLCASSTPNTKIPFPRQKNSPPGCNKSNKNLSLVCAGVQKPGIGIATSGDNLKVSIIPQNDHLMGHLTVYETLNYASKMKNCFEKQFDHKLNIKRVAQQLSLMSCLGTRINKLSGGQYKRVSIAQELLSSPDILILDEPTSGLDAMTCYQTVQVLRKLTDDRQASGQNPIAVILTIHQPNSDVFQQFNHVYVVAQGGKCIYEGTPANIESVINQVGIRLPNSYYNPATMIVEIAAGKFGSEAIYKLNNIQKKQYEFVVLDEQNSTGDSAVDCPSSSSPSSSSSSNDEDDDGANSGVDSKGCLKKEQRLGDSNNNTKNCNSFLLTVNNNAYGGLVNRGFIMEPEREKNELNNNSNFISNIKSNCISSHINIDNSKDVVVMVNKVGDNNNNDDNDSLGKIKMMNISANDQTNTDNEGKRKKRRRTRKRSGDIQAANANSNTDGSFSELPNRADVSSVACINFASNSYPTSQLSGESGGSGGSGNGSSKEKRLKLNSLKADQKFPFWRHTYLHFHRSWLSIVRDPMLCSMQLALHIIVPVMVSLVYGTNVGKPNACPRAGPMDIMAYALEPTDSALQLQEDLRTTLENIGYIFFKLYGIIFAAMTVTVLTFPLDMHVLVKEFRNGWYGLSSYFLGRTLADIPFQLTLPLLAMSLSYYATGQPYSYMQWRFLSITAILILSSLIAQSQGLLFGAILMDRMKAAVFVAPAATTPIILFAGFLVRTQSIPSYLRPLSSFSYLRYAIEACLISRYGFNQCECDPAMFNQTVPELPPIARSMLDYWLSSFKASSGSETHDSTLNSTTSLVETTTMSVDTEKPDLFTKLIDSLAKANSFGRNITSCEQVVPYPMIDYDLKDSQLINCFAILLFMLIFTRLLTFFIVCFKVKRKV